MEHNVKVSWIKRISDEMVEELIRKYLSANKTRFFKKMLKISRTENVITATYSMKVKAYMSYAEKTIHISDYKIAGIASETVLPEFMVENFGEEYARDFVEYAKDYIKNNPETHYAKRLMKVIEKIPSMIEKYEAQQLQTI